MTLSLTSLRVVSPEKSNQYRTQTAFRQIQYIAVHVGGVLPFALSNAVDLVVGESKPGDERRDRVSDSFLHRSPSGGPPGPPPSSRGRAHSCEPRRVPGLRQGFCRFLRGFLPYRVSSEPS